MAANGTAGVPSWRDDAIMVDRDGIPHYSGAAPGLMTEYRRRVLFAYNNLEGSGDDEQKEARSLAKKRNRFAKRLMDALHGEAWKVCQDLMTNEDLKKPDGYKLILKELTQIEKVSVVRKTESFEAYFERCYRKKGQSMDNYLRARKQAWDDLKDLSEGLNMSEDLLAFFALKNAGLSREERRQILLANQSSYTMEGIERALRISYHDVHDRERAPAKDWSQSPRKPKGYGKRGYAHAVHEPDADADYPDPGSEADQEEDYDDQAYANAAEDEQPDEGEPSDLGASNDEEVFDAYATYKESRQKLKEIQKNRGFKPKDPGAHGQEDRRQAVAREKARTRCSVCNRLGHWAGDRECPKRSPPAGRRRGSAKGRGKANKGKAYYVAEEPAYFTIGDSGDEDAFCNMVLGKAPDSDSSEGEMAQDSGRTALDDRRKAPRPGQGYTQSSEWEYVPPPMPGLGEAMEPILPEIRPTKGKAKKETEEVQMMIKVPKENVEVIRVKSLYEARPANMGELRLRELQCDCDRWGIGTSGTKAEVLDRLRKLYVGEPVTKKHCTKKFVKLVEFGGPTSTTSPGRAPTTRMAASSSSAAASATLTSSATAPLRTQGPTSAVVSGTFRNSGGNRHDERIICPRTGMEVPKNMSVGQPVASLSCMVCNVPMVLRRRRDGTAFFFGCGNFAGARSCRYTLELDEGLALVEKAERGQ